MSKEVHIVVKSNIKTGGKKCQNNPKNPAKHQQPYSERYS
jgi:hypothetical protein